MNETEKLTKDDVFEVLSSSRRRQILYHLYRRGGKANLRDLARDTATVENEDSVTDEVVKRLYISLYQTHVPKLEEVGLVEYDSEEMVVTLTDRVTELAYVLNIEVTPERPWALYYASLAIAGLVLTVAQMAGLAPPITTPLFVIALLALAGFQYYETNIKEREYDFLEQLVTE